MKTRTIGVVCRWITLALAPLLLVGCIADAASGVTSAVLDKIFEEGPTEIEAEMIAKADVNPDYDGQPSPLVVRMYQLSSPTAFKNAGFFALYDGDVATLGNDMTGKEELELRPGQTLEIEREFAPETRFVGFMASYRDIDNAKWRAVAELPQGETTDLVIEFRRLEVEIVEID